MRTEKLIDGFKRNFKRPETKRREAPRIHADIHELVIAKFNGFRIRLAGHDLCVSRRAWLAIPTGMNANRCSVYGPEHSGAFRISRRLHFNRAISAGERVFKTQCGACHSPLAGKNLNFDVEITDVREATEEELSHGHVHGEGGHHHHEE